MSAEVQTEIQIDTSRQRILLALFLILAAFLHLFLFLLKFNWNTPTTVNPPVEIQTIDPKKLDAIRKKSRQQSLLLDKDLNRPKIKEEAPPDARYFSDRNIRVEKEQRARDTNVIPKAGRPHEPKPQQKQSRSHPNLSKLAVPFQLDGKPKVSRPFQQESANAAPIGGDQAIDDRQLPVGSENLLNAQESIYYSFYARLYEAIGPIWQSRTSEVVHRNVIQPGEYSTLVDVVLDQNGNLVEIRRLHSAGIEAFDSAVEETWNKVQRFPNPPRGLLNSQNQVHIGWKFTVRVEQGFGLNYLPPQRSFN